MRPFVVEHLDGLCLAQVLVEPDQAHSPRLLQNLRASCETDGVEKYPSHVVAKWLGHSPKIAAQHYLMSREHHFDDVVAGGGAAEPSVAGAGQAVPESCSADCSAPAMQRSRHPRSPARNRTKRQNPLPPFRLQRVLRNVRQLPKLAEWRGQEPNKRGFVRENMDSSPSATQNETHFRLIASTCSPAR